MNTTQTTPPPPAANPPRTPGPLPTPLAPLHDRLDDLIEALALDWDDPSLSAARLCLLHQLEPEQLAAIARLPRFRDKIASLEAVRAERVAVIDARIHEDLRAVLHRLIGQNPSAPTIAKEIRLATKQLSDITAASPRGPRAVHTPDACGADSQSAIPETPLMQSADSSTPLGAVGGTGVAGKVPEQSEGAARNPDPETQPLPPRTLRVRQNPDPTPDPTPRPNSHQPKSPRGYKPRPKPKSR